MITITTAVAPRACSPQTPHGLAAAAANAAFARPVNSRSWHRKGRCQGRSLHTVEALRSVVGWIPETCTRHSTTPRYWPKPAESQSPRSASPPAGAPSAWTKPVKRCPAGGQGRPGRAVHRIRCWRFTPLWSPSRINRFQPPGFAGGQAAGPLRSASKCSAIHTASWLVKETRCL